MEAPPPRLVIRLAIESDLAAIDAIYNYYIARSTCTYQEEVEPFESRVKWFAHHGITHPVTVATVGDDIVGWGALSPFRERSAYRFTVENSVYIHPDHHRRGIGSALLADLIARGTSLGYHTIIAGIDGEQAASLALHRKFGFEICGEMKQVGYKFERFLDVIFMQKML
jgi:phosphinothricin acetyltransferase